jgi:hypothetical protein
MTQDIPNQYQPAQQAGTLASNASAPQLSVMDMPSRGEKSRSIMLDGQPIVIPTSRASEMEDSRQTKVTGNITSTPGFYRVIMPALTVRYLGRSIVDGFMRFDAANKMDFFPKTREFIDGLIGIETRNMSVNSMLDRQIDIVREAVKDNAPEDVINKAKVILTKTQKGFGEQAEGLSQIKSQAKEFNLEKVRDTLKDNLHSKAFDIGIGSIMSVATLYYTLDVGRDIIETYAETVALELYKNPKDVNMFDVFASDNKIVKETCNNFVQKTAWRALVDVVSFGRMLPDTPLMHLIPKGLHPLANALPGLNCGEFAMAIQGANLVLETQRKKTSFFTDVVDLIDAKVNTKRGLANPINSSDLLNLYQKYQSKNDPEKMFQDATRHDTEDDAVWRTANAVFERMAGLMNETYKYKHGFDKNLTPEEQLEKDVLSKQRSFALPKFIYLLGNDLVDVGDPVKTLAYAEVANNWSIQDVKLLRHALEVEGVPLHEALRSHPVDIEATMGKSTPPELLEVSALARKVDQALIEEGITKDPQFKEQREKIIQQAQQDMLEKGRADAKQGVVAPAELPIFYPAKSESLRYENENNTPVVTQTPTNFITEAESSAKIQAQTTERVI